LAEAKKEEAERKKTLSSVGFDRMLHDFGSIVADADYTTTFTIKNTGKKPLLIYEVKASCGCTVPTWNKKPIAPGASDQIEVTFHPGKSQLGAQDKTISVITNTSPGVAVLQLKAFVNPKK
jgi:archaellum component FlaG (FlaF/FlaG flagellin family)